jgi:hypothetical protein
MNVSVARGSVDQSQPIHWTGKARVMIAPLVETVYGVSPAFKMSFRAGLRASNVLRAVSARPAAYSAAHIRRSLSSTAASKGKTRVPKYHVVQLNPWSSLSSPLPRAHISESHRHPVRGDNRGAAHIRLLFDSVPAKIHPAVLRSQGRIDSVHRTLCCCPSVDLPARPSTMSIQASHGYQRCRLPGAGEAI